VLRQIRTLESRGWTVVVVGYAGGASPPAHWEFLEARPEAQATSGADTRRIRHMLLSDPPAAAKRIFQIALNLARVHLQRSRLAATEKPLPGALSHWSFAKAQRHFWRQPEMLALKRKILAEVERCDLVIAHDYMTYCLADPLARRDGARLAVDCHEYAMEQYDYGSHPDPRVRAQWITVTRPYVDALQRHFFHRADALSTVSDGIANLLQADYGLPRRPVVVRSMPFFEEIPFRPCGEHIDIVYHGLVSPTRNLDVALHVLRLCRPEFRLTIRGPVDPGYDSQIMELARQLGIEDRFRLMPSVPFSELVRSASAADIGYFVFANFSRQRQFTLPNKFFEYVMAGLALVVSDVPELSKIIVDQGNGVTVPEFSAEATAAVINSLDRSAIDRMKRRSLAAARGLCWEGEEGRLIAAYDL
jgi:glycosyltransferase involved in cell wall biosynthesis